jgi:hypothetical protein
MSGKRQNNQLRLAFSGEGRSEAPMAPGGGSETLTAKRMIETPASNHEPLMEEVCERENCLQALKRVKSNKGKSGHRRYDGGCVDCLLEGALASHPRTTACRDLQTATGEAGRDTQAVRRGASVGYPDGQRRLHWTAVRIWDGRRSVIRFTHFEASALKCSRNAV